MELAEQYRRAQDPRGPSPSDEQRERMREEIRESLARAFDERRAGQLEEIAELERRLESLRELDRRRQERKREIVERRLRQLLGEPNELDWVPHTTGPGPAGVRGRGRVDGPGPRYGDEMSDGVPAGERGRDAASRTDAAPRTDQDRHEQGRREPPGRDHFGRTERGPDFERRIWEMMEESLDRAGMPEEARERIRDRLRLLTEQRERERDRLRQQIEQRERERDRAPDRERERDRAPSRADQASEGPQAGESTAEEDGERDEEPYRDGDAG